MLNRIATIIYLLCLLIQIYIALSGVVVSLYFCRHSLNSDCPGKRRSQEMTKEISQEERAKILEEVTPPTQDYSHQDSLFGNAFQSRAYFIVHPEWLSENVNPPISKPLDRKPWPWEQPKYRQNVQRYVNGEMTPDTTTPTRQRSPQNVQIPYQPYSYTHPLRNENENGITRDLLEKEIMESQKIEY